MSGTDLAHVETARACARIVLDLPLCPSTNGLYLNNVGKGHKGRRVAPDYSVWQWSAAVALKAQAPGFVSGPYQLRIFVPANMRGDVSNRVKAVEDFLVTQSVTPDDRHCVHVSAERSPDVQPGRMRVEITEWRR